MDSTSYIMLAWVFMTPLGRPVVPDVYIKRWTSSPAHRTRGGMLVAVRSSASIVHPSGRGPEMQARTMVASIPFVASVARSASDSSQISDRASECSRM